MTADSQAVADSGAVANPASDDYGGDERRSLAEWVTLLCSIAILTGTFAMVTYLYIAGNGDPIVIRTEAKLDQIRVADEIFYVPVDVDNDGDTMAENVQVQAELIIGDETETSEFSILTLAGNDTETGIIAFTRDLREGEFTVRVASYIE